MTRIKELLVRHRLTTHEEISDDIALDILDDAMSGRKLYYLYNQVDGVSIPYGLIFSLGGRQVRQIYGIVRKKQTEPKYIYVICFWHAMGLMQYMNSDKIYTLDDIMEDINFAKQLVQLGLLEKDENSIRFTGVEGVKAVKSANRLYIRS